MNKFFRLGIMTVIVIGAIIRVFIGPDDNLSQEVASWGYNIVILLSLLVYDTLFKEK